MVMVSGGVGFVGVGGIVVADSRTRRRAVKI